MSTRPGNAAIPGSATVSRRKFMQQMGLFAALNVLTGEILGKCAKRHCHTEWMDFLRLINKNTPKDKEIHIICDNYATHKHPKVQSWLKYHKRFHVHFTPTSA